jgi:hypothetical protein
VTEEKQQGWQQQQTEEVEMAIESTSLRYKPNTLLDDTLFTKSTR